MCPEPREPLDFSPINSAPDEDAYQYSGDANLILRNIPLKCSKNMFWNIMPHSGAMVPRRIEKSLIIQSKRSFWCGAQECR